MGGVSETQNPPRDGEGDRAQRGGGGLPPSLRRPETYRARRLRREMSLPEVLLWQRLNGQQVGVKFRKQHSIPPFTVDFYCPRAKLVVEVDGLAHDNSDSAASDAARDNALRERGYDVLRLPALLVLNAIEEAVDAIVARVETPLRQSLRDRHLPMNGEDL